MHLNLAFLAAFLLNATARGGAPHIMLLVTDQHRWDAFGGLEPSGQLKTPNFDRLLDGGVRFDRHYSSTPSCTPARGALLTGRSPWRHGQLGYGKIAKNYAPYLELPKAMAMANYKTVEVGKNHFCNGEADCEKPHGFEELFLYDGLETEIDQYRKWFNTTSDHEDPMATAPAWDPSRPLTFNDWRGAAYAYNEAWHPTAWTARKAAEIVANHKDDRPLFLKLSFHRPHSPYDPPQRLLDKIDSTKLTAPILSKDGWDRTDRGVCDASKVNYTKAKPTDIPAGMWCGALDLTETRESRKAYLASVMFVDEGLGKVLDAFEARSWLENTFIIFTADHGDSNGDHFLWRKTYPYESSARIPMIVRPGKELAQHRNLKTSAVVKQVTEIRDVLPTLLDAANATHLIPANQPLDGSSVLPLLAKTLDQSSWRSWVDMEHATCYNASMHWSALVSSNRKYIFHAVTGKEQLFDLDADPGETLDLALDARFANEVALWRSRMVSQFESEGRGNEFVSKGELVWPRKNIVYSPNYPKPSLTLEV